MPRLLLPKSATSLASHSGPPTRLPADPYPLSEPSDVEIDQVDHDIYVTDPGNHRIEKFNEKGEFLLMFGKEVDKTTGANLCTAASGDTCQSGISAATPGAFETPAYLAVDNAPGGEGDLYVADTGTNLVSKFDSSGHLLTAWGANGQKDGSDAPSISLFGAFFGLAVGPEGDLLVGANKDNGHVVWQYTREGTYVPLPAYGLVQNYAEETISVLNINSEGHVLFGETPFAYFGNHAIVMERYFEHGSEIRNAVTEEAPTWGLALDPVTNEIYQGIGTEEEGGVTVHGPQIDRYSGDCDPSLGPCHPIDSFGGAQLVGAMGIAIDGGSHAVYVARSTSNDVAVFDDVRPIVTTGPPTGVTESSATLTGRIDPAGYGDITACHFEYGFDTTYGRTLPCTPDPSLPGANFKVPTVVTSTVTGLSPGTADHYRLVATNAAGATRYGPDQTFITTQPPSVEGLSSENLTATSADLSAKVNPNGLDTTYRFEYGPSALYGQSAPVPDGAINASNSKQQIGVHLENLVPDDVYHYRLVAANADGTTTTGDQSFNFAPPPCPNEAVRQQTQANYLPDCRAYELVSPEFADGTTWTPFGPNTGLATNPSRLSFTGYFGSPPGGGGGEPIGGSGDLYVATRTDTGWVTRYVGLSGKQAAVAGGPPMGPPDSTPWPDHSPNVETGAEASNQAECPRCENFVWSDEAMDRFADFNDGSQAIRNNFPLDSENHTIIGSDAPYIWNSEGSFLERWPSDLASVPAGVWPREMVLHEGERPSTVAPGGMQALDCPSPQYCAGDVTASADFSHFVLSTNWNQFSPEGQLSPPGSVYDNNTAAHTVTVASKLPAGGDIPQQPTDSSGDPLQIPAVSSDGSHILMAAGGSGPCSPEAIAPASCGFPPCVTEFSMTHRCPMQPSNLYMRVDGAVTYDVSEGHIVTYVGMTPDGSKVYFTSTEPLVSEDTDTSVDLYMWSEATNSLTLISKGSNGAGNSDECNSAVANPSRYEPSSKCGAFTPYRNQQWFCTSDVQSKTSLDGSVANVFEGGNCLSDNFIAANSGDIYFFSPEQLDGTRGIPNQQNMYVYRNGQVQYVTTFTGPPQCFETQQLENCTRLLRIQVSPDGSHMAFVTRSQITEYNNEGFTEMYTYEPSSGKLVCASCLPSGEPPTSNVRASQDGLFMTNDGRVFFSTEDSLVETDTNRANDVYEYVGGRPQLITTGTGSTKLPFLAETVDYLDPGLIGVSADGRDVYFSTYDTLVPQDHNGSFLKIYDARAGGGFAVSPPPPPCVAADECHGPGSEPPPDLHIASGDSLGAGGNMPRISTRHRAGRHHRRHHRRKARVAPSVDAGVAGE